ncbi:hypothetical protein [Oceaniglobus roseus]|uniref:hypothetical protein n=1 Tax=Oceaniglobus roseus TaxID=1737570 RepID=UPI000C7E9CBF|nr:hypothetical protein [Kandeliimicrobium roseum]
MIRDHALTTLPNVTALKVLRFARVTAALAARQPFVGSGDPQLGHLLAADLPAVRIVSCATHGPLSGSLPGLAGPRRCGPRCRR